MVPCWEPIPDKERGAKPRGRCSRCSELREILAFGADALGSGPELCELVVVQVELHDLLDTLAPEPHRHADVHPVDPVLPAAPRAHPDNLPRVAGDRAPHPR